MGLLDLFRRKCSVCGSEPDLRCADCGKRFCEACSTKWFEGYVEGMQKRCLDAPEDQHYVAWAFQQMEEIKELVRQGKRVCVLCPMTKSGKHQLGALEPL